MRFCAKTSRPIVYLLIYRETGETDSPNRFHGIDFKILYFNISSPEK